jgi:hypothetical protein
MFRFGKFNDTSDFSPKVKFRTRLPRKFCNDKKRKNIWWGNLFFYYLAIFPFSRHLGNLFFWNFQIHQNVRRRKRGISRMQRGNKNNSGPRADPWGTPVSITHRRRTSGDEPVPTTIGNANDCPQLRQTLNPTIPLSSGQQ